MAAARLRTIMVYVRRSHFPVAARFYEHALALPVLYNTEDEGAEFQAGHLNVALVVSDKYGTPSVLCCSCSAG